MRCAPSFWVRLIGAAAVAALLLLPQPVAGKALDFGAEIVKPPAWPKNATINVFIQADPKGLGRDTLVKEGVERWKKTLADKMITLNVAIGNAPANAVNPVQFTWEADGYKEDDHELGPGKDAAFAGPKLEITTDADDRVVGSKFVGGSGVIRNALPAATAAEKEFLKNLGEHEMVHVMGLADDPKGAITKHEQPDTARPLQNDKQQFNDQDKKEFGSLYARLDTPGVPKGAAELLAVGLLGPIGGGDDVVPLPVPLAMRFDYRFTFHGVGAAPDPENPEHVALINFGIDPELAVGAIVPPGWRMFIPGPQVAAQDPFFDCYMEDVISSLSPWNPQRPMGYLSARTDGCNSEPGPLDAGDAALGFGRAVLDISVLTLPDVGIGPIDIWAGGELQPVLGPVALLHAIPEPPALWLLLTGLAALALARRARPAS